MVILPVLEVGEQSTQQIVLMRGMPMIKSALHAYRRQRRRIEPLRQKL
jgi:hypothetical protein